MPSRRVFREICGNFSAESLKEDETAKFNWSYPFYVSKKGQSGGKGLEKTYFSRQFPNHQKCERNSSPQKTSHTFSFHVFCIAEILAETLATSLCISLRPVLLALFQIKFFVPNRKRHFACKKQNSTHHKRESNNNLFKRNVIWGGWTGPQSYYSLANFVQLQAWLLLCLFK